MLKELKIFMPLVLKIRARKPTINCLNYICVEYNAMRLTNLETTIIIPVDDNRKYCLPIDILDKIIRQHPSEMEINFLEEDNRIEIVYDNKEITFPSIDPAEYPSVPLVQMERIGVWSQIFFIKIHNQITFTSTDELKPALNGVFVKQTETKLTSCATDSHRMNYMENLQEIDGVKIDRSFKGIIPSTFLKSVIRFMNKPVVVYAGEDFISFELHSGIQIYTRLIDEEFPDVDAIIRQEGDNVIEVDQNLLLSAIKSSLPFTDSETKLIKFIVQNGSIGISASDSEHDIEFDTIINHNKRRGKEITIGFNSTYLTTVVDGLKSDVIQWQYYDEKGPSLFKTIPNDDTTMLLMPIRLEADDE